MVTQGGIVRLLQLAVKKQKTKIRRLLLHVSHGRPTDRLSKKLEMGANIAIIALAGLMGLVLVRNYVLAKPQQAESVEDSNQAKNRTISVTGVDWHENGQTLFWLSRLPATSAPKAARSISNSLEIKVRLTWSRYCRKQLRKESDTSKVLV